MNSRVGSDPILLVLAADDKSFFAFKRQTAQQLFSWQGDTLSDGQYQYSLKGTSYNGGQALPLIPAYQAFWHSWQTFHPHKEKYPAALQ